MSDWKRTLRRSASLREVIFVFTSNHPEALDPALLRPGRCDLHICLSYCSFEVRAHGSPPARC